MITLYFQKIKTMTMKTGMLVVTCPSKFVRLIPRIQKKIKNTLYVQFFPEKRLKIPDLKPVKFAQSPPPTFSSSIINIYSESISYRHLDVRVLLGSIRDINMYKISTKAPVEIIYFDQLFDSEEMQGFLINCVQNRTSNCELVALDDLGQELGNLNENLKNDSSDITMYDNVVLGGTFDRLHSGHKILLSEAIIRCNKKLTIGVTDTEMLKTKKLWELIEPCDIRIQKVRDFLEDIEPNLKYDVIPISDMYGPTKSDPSFQMLIVSSETLQGGSKVNELRLKNGLNPLAIHSVDLLNDIKLDDEEEDKISSSNCRLRLLGKRIREPEEQPYITKSLEPLPYIIGLTGSIASGKSSISSRLAALGGGVIDCDKIGHDLYKRGCPVYNTIVDMFGSKIIGSDGQIDRKVLGTIVFNDKKQLDCLNKVLWPAILKTAKELVLDLYDKGHKVIIMEAAVLIQAGWNKHCHEIWTCIIPPDEAIRRIKERTGLSEEEAKSRLMSQPSNFEQVSNAHLVFCTLWRPEYTQKQVVRAWNELIERLSSV